MYICYLELKKDYINIEKTLKYNENSSSMLDTMDKTAQICIEFWTDVKSNFHKSKIYDSAVKISKNIKIISENYNELVNSFKYKNVKLMVLYYDFLDKIISYEQVCKEIQKKIIKFTQTIFNSSYIEFKEVSMVKF